MQQQIEATERQRKEEKEATERQRKEEKEALDRQRKEEKEALDRQRKEEKEAMERQHQRQMEALVKMIQPGIPAVTAASTVASAMPSFAPFDASSELWTDYWARFCTFTGAHSVPEERKAQVFLTNQTPTVYKLLANLASQKTPPKDVNYLLIDEIVTMMKDQFDPKRFTVRERFKFWSDMQRKPGETIQELAARIRQDAATCDFSSIKDPQDEALRTRFICSVNNEAVLKALFKIKDDDLDFARAIQIAMETEDAAKVAKETVHGNKAKPVNQVKQRDFDKSRSAAQSKNHSESERSRDVCYRCGSQDHKASVCRFKDVSCNFCKTKGHLQKVCRKKANAAKTSSKQPLKWIQAVNAVPADQEANPKLEVAIVIKDRTLLMELDTATTGNFISRRYWEDLGCPELRKSTWKYESASKHDLPVLGTFVASTTVPESNEIHSIQYTVTEVPDLNLLGRSATKQMGISVDKILSRTEPCNAVFDQLKPDYKLRDQCQALCKNFPELWKPGLGCLKDFELDIKFKPNAKPVFRKPRPVPCAIEDSLNQAIEEGIANEIWEPTQFNDYGTPVVPVKKRLLPGQEKPTIRVCGDYSVTVNQQLEDHRHPLPLPEDLMRRLGGGYGFTKIDLADAYNQIKLTPRSQRRLALSTSKGVLLQKRLPFGIKSAPGYFQQIMDQLTQDLPGTAVYLDDILVSGKNAEDHLSNLRRLLQRLEEKGLRCRLEKCKFAEPSVEYLGHLLSHEGIAKGPKVNDVLKMHAPTDVPTLKAFLGSVQFYAKFLSPDLATIAEPLYRLTRKNTPWTWSEAQEEAFRKLKEQLSSENVLVHYNKDLPIGIACDASNVGIGAVLFHRFPGGIERPIANVSKTLTDAQRNYSQIQKEALAIIFGLKKFYQFVYGRRFTLVTDHRPLLSIFGPGKETPALAANRLARWALMLSQFDYSIEYRRTADHANADVLSRLPTKTDSLFDGEESEDDSEMVCAITEISEKVEPGNQSSLMRYTEKDPVLSSVLRFTREGWPPKNGDEGSDMQRYRQIADSLSICHGCLMFGNRVVIPSAIRHQVLEHLHLGHFGMHRMKQLARTAVYWPNINEDIEATCRHCVPCGEHQNKPPKPAVHPWMLPEKPWSRLHLDHAINFMGCNWLVLTDAYSKYPCIHMTHALTAKATTEILEEDFAHFGYPHTIVTDNAALFLSKEFKLWCNERGITHLTGAPYHPATNGSAERLVQTFKQAIRKSRLPPRRALQEFLMQYRRTPTSNGYSPSEMLNSRQLRTKIDTLLPSPVHIAQGKQSRQASKDQEKETVAKLSHSFNIGDPVYALYFGPRRDQEPRWVPAVITKRKGTRTFNVRVWPRGPCWRRHLEQLQRRYVTDDDNEPGETPMSCAMANNAEPVDAKATELQTRGADRIPIEERTADSSSGDERPRRSKRTIRPPRRFSPS